jgi:hypothetical protein
MSVTSATKVVLFQALPEALGNRRQALHGYVHSALQLEPPSKSKRGELLTRVVEYFRREFPFAYGIVIGDFPYIYVWCDEEEDLVASFNGWNRCFCSYFTGPFDTASPKTWSENPWAADTEELIDDCSDHTKPFPSSVWTQGFVARVKAEGFQANVPHSAEVVMPLWMEGEEIAQVSAALLEAGFKSRFSKGPRRWTLRALMARDLPGEYDSAETWPDGRSETLQSEGLNAGTSESGDGRPTVAPFNPPGEMLAIAIQTFAIIGHP